MFHLQFKCEGHLLYFIQLNVCPVVTFLTYFNSPTDLDYFFIFVAKERIELCNCAYETL